MNHNNNNFDYNFVIKIIFIYIVLREQEGPISSAGLVPVVVVDAGGTGALHVAAPGIHEGSAWRHALYQAAITCGPALEQQQLTQDNVPVILDKCINFIYAHGMYIITL